MGLMLSILVVCVGVIEALSCFEHFQYGVIHCATNVYETARRRSSVFLKYTSRRLKLLSENSISEYDEQPEINVFEPIKFGYDERQTQFSEEGSDDLASIRKPKTIRISARPVRKLEKEDKIQIVKTLLERPRRPPTVRSISMPELVHTEEGIELSKIINDLAIEPIEEINIEIEDGNCEVLSRKFDELFNEEGPGGLKESLLDEENVSDGLERLEERKLALLEVVVDFDDKSISEETEIDEENPKSEDLSPEEVENDVQSTISDKSGKEDEKDFLKVVLRRGKPVIQANISQRVSDKGADYFNEVMSKSSKFDRSISVDFNKLPSMRINKPGARFSEMSNDSMKLISEEYISRNKLEDIILESDTPPGEVIDETFEEIYENICEESLDAENTFEEIEKNILEDAIVDLEGQGSPSPIPSVPEDQFILVNDMQQTETFLSNGKTVSTAVFKKAVEQLAQLLVRDSLNLHKIKNLIFENLNNLNYNEKINSCDKLDSHLPNQPENKKEIPECKIQKETVLEWPDLKHLIKSEGKEITNDECLGEELTKTILVNKEDLTNVRLPVEEEFEKMSFLVLEGGVSNFSDADFEAICAGSDKTEEVKSDEVLERLLSEIIPEENDLLEEVTFSETVALTGIENITESSHESDQNVRIQEMKGKDGHSNKSVESIKEDKINSLLSKNEEAVEFVKKLEGQKTQLEDVLEIEPAPSLLEFPTLSDISKNEIEKDFIIEDRKNFSQSKGATDAEDNKNIQKQAIIDLKNKAINVIDTEAKALDKPPAVELEKLKENEKINVECEIFTHPDTKFQGHSDVESSVTSIKPKEELLLALEFKKDLNFEQDKMGTEFISEQDNNKMVVTLEKPVPAAVKNAFPNKQAIEVIEKVQEEKPVPVETEKPKDKSEISVRQDMISPVDSHIVIETVQSKHEPLLDLELKNDVNSEQNKKGTEISPEQDKYKEVEALEKAVALDVKSTFPNKQTVGLLEMAQEEKLLPVETEKPKRQDITSPGDSSIVTEFVESKHEPLLTLEFKQGIPSEEDIKETQRKSEPDKNTKFQDILPLVEEKNNFLANKEAAVDSLEKLQQEKPLPKDTGKPKDNGISLRQDTISPAGLSIITESIQTVQSQCEPLLEFQKGNNSDKTGKTVTKQDTSKNTVQILSVEPAQTGQSVLEIHDKVGECEQNVEFQRVDNTEAMNTDKSHSDITKNPESTKTNVESKTEPPRQDNQNERTQKRIGVKDQNNKTVDVLNTETKLIDEEHTFLPRKEKAIDSVEELQEDKPLAVEILEDNIQTEISAGLGTTHGDSDMNKSVEAVLVVQQKEGINTGENKKQKNVEEKKNIKMEEVTPGDTAKQSGELALKFHDTPGETEVKLEFEQVEIVEGNDVDKLQINSRNEAEPAGLGSPEKKEEHSSDTKNSGATSSAPEAFWLIFSGEYTKAMSKDWHSGHFSCWQCDEALTGQRYVLRDDHPYCIKCYESVFANVCEECNKIIGIDSKDLSYKDKHWHEACFLCNKCRVSLVDKQFGSKADKIYCGNCYDAQFASRCDGCGEIFRAGTKKMEYKTRQWHEKCFCCCVCKTPIGTKSFIPREQEIYCATCYEEKFATRCVKCNKIITSGGVTYKNEPWHRECFTCTNCNTSLAGQRFTSRDEKPYCADCFGELFAKRCTACSRPITGIGGTRFISFEDRHWHNDCFICASCKTSLVGRGFITDADDIICPECAKQKLM